MTKQQFLDQLVIAAVSSGNWTGDASTRWSWAEEIWEARPKTERVTNPDKKSETEAKEVFWKDFWNNYDKKVGTDAAKAKFMAIDVSEMPKVVDMAKLYAESTPEVKYRKHPSTWLNQKCWLDSRPVDGNKSSQFKLV